MRTRVFAARWLLRLCAGVLALAAAGAIPVRATQALRVWTDAVVQVAPADRPTAPRPGRAHPAPSHAGTARARVAGVAQAPVRDAATQPRNAVWPTADTVSALLAFKHARLI